jgi:uncharacterized small protein (DUF1192 family)
MPRTCTLCNHPGHAEIDRELLNGTPFRNIAKRFGTSISAIARHKPHISDRVAAAERESGYQTIQNIQSRMAELQARVERLVAKLEKGKDHRTTLAGLRECREGLKVMHEVLVTSDLAKRLAALEEQAPGQRRDGYGGEESARDDYESDEEAAA